MATMLNNQMVGHFKQGPILLSTILLPRTCAWSIRKWTTLKTWATTSTSKDPLLLCPFCWDVGLTTQLLSLRFFWQRFLKVLSCFGFFFWEQMLFHFHSINGGSTWEDFHLESRTSSFVLFPSQGPNKSQRRSGAGYQHRGLFEVWEGRKAESHGAHWGERGLCCIGADVPWPDLAGPETRYHGFSHQWACMGEH